MCTTIVDYDYHLKRNLAKSSEQKAEKYITIFMKRRNKQVYISIAYSVYTQQTGTLTFKHILIIVAHLINATILNMFYFSRTSDYFKQNMV